MISSQNKHFMRYTDHVRRLGCHKVLIETDTDGPHDGPHTIQYRIATQCIDR